MPYKLGDRLNLRCKCGRIPVLRFKKLAFSDAVKKGYQNRGNRGQKHQPYFCCPCWVPKKGGGCGYLHWPDATESEIQEAILAQRTEKIRENLLARGAPVSTAGAAVGKVNAKAQDDLHDSDLESTDDDVPLPTDGLQSTVKRETHHRSANAAEAGKKRPLKRSESMLGCMNAYELLIANRQENKTSTNEVEKDERGLDNSARALISSDESASASTSAASASALASASASTSRVFTPMGVPEPPPKKPRKKSSGKRAQTTSTSSSSSSSARRGSHQDLRDQMQNIFGGPLVTSNVEIDLDSDEDNSVSATLQHVGSGSVRRSERIRAQRQVTHCIEDDEMEWESQAGDPMEIDRQAVSEDQMYRFLLDAGYNDERARREARMLVGVPTTTSTAPPEPEVFVPFTGTPHKLGN